MGLSTIDLVSTSLFEMLLLVRRSGTACNFLDKSVHQHHWLSRRNVAADIKWFTMLIKRMSGITFIW